MPVTITPPQPGDIITAQFMQDLLTQLSALDTRLTSVEQLVPGSHGELVITNVSPSLPASGGEVQISGVNFHPSDGGTLVTFDGANPRSSFKTGSNDRLLIVDLPVFTMTGDTKNVSLAISNNRGGFDHRTVTVARAVETVSTGTLVVSQVGWPDVANNIIPVSGGHFVFPFKAELVAATMDETYNVEVALPAGWTWKLTADVAGTVDRPNAIFMARPSGVPLVTPLYVKVTIPGITVPNPTGSIEVTLRASRNSSYIGTTGPLSFPIGSTLPGMGTIAFALPPTVLGAGSQVNGAEVSFPVPTPVDQAGHVIPGQVTVRGLALKALDYQVDITWKNGAANGWTATLGPNPLAPTATKVFTQAQVGSADTRILLLAAAGATNATLQIAIKATAQPTVEFGSLQLVVKPA